VKSLAINYRKTFSFVLDNEILSDFITSSYDETEDSLCSISQMYYDEGNNQARGCGLLYDKDLSYAAIYWKTNYTFYPMEL